MHVSVCEFFLFEVHLITHAESFSFRSILANVAISITSPYRELYIPLKIKNMTIFRVEMAYKLAKQFKRKLSAEYIVYTHGVHANAKKEKSEQKEKRR